MAILDYILDGLEAALELERELGVRIVEIDRALLTDSASKVSGLASSPGEDARRQTLDAKWEDARRETGVAKREDVRRETPDNRTIEQSNSQAIASLVFLHDRPLSPRGVEMVAKIIGALGLTAETAPVIVAPPIPNAKIYVFLGFPALRKYMPTLRIEENCWGKSPKGKDILVVKSPEEILRFATVTPAVEKIKRDMWRSLKAVKQRLAV